jgi:hypothetical protein
LANPVGVCVLCGSLRVNASAANLNISRLVNFGR